jgi:hypothetical protein
MNKVRKNGYLSNYALAVILVLLVARPSWSLELTTVLQNVSVMPPARVGFREERHNELFKDALILTGYLEYFDTHRLRKVIESPFQEALLVDADRIEITRDGNVTTVSLNKSRALRTMLDGIKAILAGHDEQLMEVFNYELSGSENDWVMKLTPKSRRIAKQLNSLLVTGSSNAVTSFRFDLQGGEWHVMEILDSEF